MAAVQGMELWYTPQEIADAAQVGVRTVRGWIHAGTRVAGRVIRLRADRFGQRTYRVPGGALEEYLEAVASARGEARVRQARQVASHHAAVRSLKQMGVL